MLRVTQLYPCTSKITAMRQNNKRNRNNRHSFTTQTKVINSTGTPYFKGDNHTEVDHPVPCIWTKATPDKFYPLDVVGIIHSTCSISTKRDTIKGDTTPDELYNIEQTVFYNLKLNNQFNLTKNHQKKETIHLKIKCKVTFSMKLRKHTMKSAMKFNQSINQLKNRIRNKLGIIIITLKSKYSTRSKYKTLNRFRNSQLEDQTINYSHQ